MHTCQLCCTQTAFTHALLLQDIDKSRLSFLIAIANCFSIAITIRKKDPVWNQSDLSFDTESLELGRSGYVTSIYSQWLLLYLYLQACNSHDQLDFGDLLRRQTLTRHDSAGETFSYESSGLIHDTTLECSRCSTADRLLAIY